MKENLKRRPVVDEVLYALNINNTARHGVEQKLVAVQVKSIGRLYFKVIRSDGGREVEYCIYTWAEKNDSCPNSQLYASHQEYEDEVESKEILSNLRQIFTYNTPNISLENLRKIHQLTTHN